MKRSHALRRTPTLLLCLVMLLVSTLPASAHNAPSARAPSNQRAEARPPGIATETYTISGQVTGRAGTPLPGVQISAGPALNATTGPDGAYTLLGLATGTYTVTASLPGYRLMPGAATVQVPPDRSTLDFTSALEMSPVGQIGGVTSAVMLQGDLAFINRGPRLAILDVRDPAQPTLVSQTDVLSARVTALLVAGHYAYVLAGQLYVFDVSDPTQPNLVGQAGVAGRGWDLALRENYIYFGTDPGGIGIVNVADPAHPVVLEQCCNLAAWTTGVTTDGGRLYTAGGDGLAVFDLADPAHPTAIGKIPIARAEDVIVSGRYAYVAAGRSGLHVVDIADPAQPVEVGALPMSENDGNLTLAGHIVYYGARENGLRVIDVADPTHPIEVGRLDTPDHANNAAAAGDLVYLADYAAGLRVINVADPTQPHEVGAYDPGPGYVTTLALDSNILYTGYAGNWVWPGIRALDVSTPSAPRVVGGLNLPGSVEAILIHGSHAFVAAGLAGLRVISIADPAHMQEVGAYDTPGSSYTTGLALVGHYVYVADGEGGLRVFDVSDPTHPQETAGLSPYPTTSNVIGVGTDGKYAYVLASGYETRVLVVGITDPAHPTLLGSALVPLNYWAYSVAAANGRAYVALGTDGLYVVDAANPTAPSVIGSLDTPGYAIAVALAGAYAFIADDTGGLRSVLVANPARPVEAGSQPTISTAWSVAIGCFVAFAGIGAGGVEILRTDICPTTLYLPLIHHNGT